MKRIYFLILLSLVSLAGTAQSVTADLFFSNNHLEDLSGNLINANAISYNQVVKVIVNVLNGNAPGGEAAPAGHFRIKIGLGIGMTVNQGFDLSTAPLSDYFSWSLDASGAQPQIVGNSIAPLPANFAGTASFELKATTAGTSTVSFNFLIANPIGTSTPLSDPDPSNNVASNEYTVAGQLGFTTSISNVSCFGSNNGSIGVNVSGGIGPFVYSIVNTTTNATASNGSGVFTGLSPATYTITVTDAVSSVTTGSVTIAEPAEVTVSATATNVSCNGAADGTISVSGLSNGTSYTVKKDGAGMDLSSRSTFGPGTYYVVASAPNGNGDGTCTKQVIVTITEPVEVTVSAISTNVSCNGQTDGTIIVTASNGATVKIDGNLYNPSTHYGPGIYNIVATAPNGNNDGSCTAITSVTISEPSVVTLSASSTNVSCNGAANGTITAMASIGATITVNGVPYNPAATYGPGNYTVVATAPGGNTGQTCTKQTMVTITEPSAVTVSATKTDVTCNGAANGTIVVTASPGATYVIRKNGAGADLSTQTTFDPGTYVITASAANGNNNGFCTATATVTIAEPTVLVNNYVSQVNNVCHGGTDGQLNVSASGGTAPYSYVISSGPTVNTSGQTSGSFTGLAAGMYTITLTDNKGCTATVTKTITEPVNADADVILSVADYTDNFFPTNNTNVTLIYQLTEINGNPAKTAQIKITKQSGYTYSLLSVPSITVGSGINATTYTLDNRWMEDNTDGISYYLNLSLPKQLDCGQSVYIAVKLSRTTPNKSTFTLTSNVRNVSGETRLNNNSTTVVLVGQ